MSRIPDPARATNFSGAEARETRGRTLFSKSAGSVTLDDFKLLKVVGRGSFGKVMLVQHKETSEVYAMKSLRKDALIERGQIAHTKTERMIMEHANHPFMVNL